MPLVLRIQKTEFHFTNTLYFIIQMLKDKNKNYFVENKIPDKEVFELRQKYFNIN